MRAPTDRDRLDAFLRALARTVRSPLRFYLVGGSVLVDLGLRTATLDVDYVARADDPRALSDFERQLPVLKEQLDINVEPASPTDFMPVAANALDRSRYIRSYGRVAVYHYHYASLALAKVARAAERDLGDVELLMRTGVVSWEDVERAWADARSQETGWLRHTPAQVEERMVAMRRRLQETGLLQGPASEM
jgi:hypothetical protein